MRWNSARHVIIACLWCSQVTAQPVSELSAPSGLPTPKVPSPSVTPQALAQPSPAPREQLTREQFSGARAFEVLKEYVTLGERYYGAPKRAQLIQRLREGLASDGGAGQAPILSALDHFSATDAQSGVTYQLTNIIVRLHPERPRRVLLGTHWDTRLWAEEDQDPARRGEPITGANDGTSGVAVLFELSRLARSAPLKSLGVDLVLFDGEEFGRPKSDDYCQGSKRFAASLSRWYEAGPPLAVFVLDMVGDLSLNLPPERSSLARARSLTQLVYSVAQSLGVSAFTTSHVGPWIVDDHTPFQELGIPSMLLIDYDYPQWHTHQDDLSRCSPESLEQVGRVMWETLKRVDASLDLPPTSPP